MLVPNDWSLSAKHPIEMRGRSNATRLEYRASMRGHKILPMASKDPSHKHSTPARLSQHFFDP
jgi:hypothetical protein